MDSALQHEFTQLSLRKLSVQPKGNKSRVPLASAERVVQTTKVVAVAVSSYAMMQEHQIPRDLNRIDTPESISLVVAVEVSSYAMLADERKPTR